MHRILISSFDKGANSELAKLLAQKNRSLIQSDNEFQHALETADKYKWLNLFISMEEFYRQTLLFLWFDYDSLVKRGKLVTSQEYQRAIDYSNEILFQPYTNKKLYDIRTRIFFIQMGQKVKYNDLVFSINLELDRDNIPTFSAEKAFSWDFPYEIMELTRP
jgi:hypothetical protein